MARSNRKTPKRNPRIPWSSFSKKFVDRLCRMATQDEILDAVAKECGTRPTWNTTSAYFSRSGLKPKVFEVLHVADRLDGKQQENFRKLWTSDASISDVEEVFPGIKRDDLRRIAQRLKVKRGSRKEQDTAFDEVISPLSPEEALAEMTLPEREWDDPLQLEMMPGAWADRAVRIGLMSGIAYGNDGMRGGLINLAMELLRDEGIRLIINNAHVVDGKSVVGQVAERTVELREESRGRRATRAGRERYPALTQASLRDKAAEDVVQAVARDLSSLIPQILRPLPMREKGRIPFVKMYTLTTPDTLSLYDGKYGESIAEELQHIRDDIILYGAGGDWIYIRDFDIKIGILNPSRSRLPGKYQSTAGEKEIDEKERQTSQDFPDLWIVNPFAAAVFQPAGIRARPYIMGPALRRLEEVHTAENQAGIMILEYRPNRQKIVRNYSFRDLIRAELKTIVTPRGATKTQKRIVATIGEHGALPIGTLEDRMPGVSRATIEREISGLVSSTGKLSTRKTWPGLVFDSRSKRYYFDDEWIQRKLRYRWPKDLVSDRMLFFGCLHAGYTTTDYEHFVKEYPRIMLEYGVDHLFGLGDMIAGLKHGLACSGEVFGGMNYTEQEVFAAELVATVLFKTFRARLEVKRGKKSLSDLSSEELSNLLSDSLVHFHYIHGNHDLWQEYDGQIPLQQFNDVLVRLLHDETLKMLIEERAPAIDLFEILASKTSFYSDFAGVAELPSGIRVSMQHPQMGRAQTTTLRAQHAMGTRGAQISALANFHASATVAQWTSDLGQCVAMQAGTQVIYTRFERRKMKKEVDFGPLYLHVQSKGGRIYIDERAAFNESILKVALNKKHDSEGLKRKLGLLRHPDLIVR
ncbi:MAG: hypothetical protein O2794_01010 [bacterium]|nr:hypothetical protein [bacterium]